MSFCAELLFHCVCSPDADVSSVRGAAKDKDKEKDDSKEVGKLVEGLLRQSVMLEFDYFVSSIKGVTAVSPAKDKDRHASDSEVRKARVVCYLVMCIKDVYISRVTACYYRFRLL